MKTRRDLYSWAALCIAFLFLILDVKCAMTGVSEGIDLCIRAVIPAIFPFLILSPVLVSQTPTIPIPQTFFSLTGIPHGSESILIASFLCGYPIGAQMVCNARRNGQLNAKEAKRMLGFCNNAGPAFIFGIGSTLFEEKWIPWAIWIIHILSALFVSILLPDKSRRRTFQTNSNTISFRKNLEQSISTMGHICGWVIVFRIILSFLQDWALWFLPKWAEVMICGILELSTGCTSILLLDDPYMKIIFFSAFLAFGGICVHMQTASVISEHKATLVHLKGKVLHCLISIFLSSLLILLSHPNTITGTIFVVFITDIAMLILTFFVVRRKKGSNMKLCGV